MGWNVEAGRNVTPLPPEQCTEEFGVFEKDKGQIFLGSPSMYVYFTG